MTKSQSARKLEAKNTIIIRNQGKKPEHITTTNNKTKLINCIISTKLATQIEQNTKQTVNSSLINLIAN
ncbi:hypothetical protein TW81_07860 [Vibrio galatheae]|uniref:Uncharacterized protein n=1 Tax=Vibrio galatheae TaxID=579748 RepID=A0A0F4NNL4_9VIBR|nr:hypothetical protein TW81_07860 [Vibrio galatheae]